MLGSFLNSGAPHRAKPRRALAPQRDPRSGSAHSYEHEPSQKVVIATRRDWPGGELEATSWRVASMEALPLPQSVAAWLQVVDEGLYLSRARGAQRPARAPYLRPRTHAGGFQLSKGSQKSGLSSRPDRACNHASFARVNRRTPPLTRGSGPRRRRLARSAHAIEASALRARPRWRPPEAARDLRPHVLASVTS